MNVNKDRAKDKTVLGVSMPKSLKERIQRVADADHRDMAPWCVIQLEKAVAKLEVELFGEIQTPPSQPAPLELMERQQESTAEKQA